MNAKEFLMEIADICDEIKECMQCPLMEMCNGNVYKISYNNIIKISKYIENHIKNKEDVTK